MARSGLFNSAKYVILNDRERSDLRDRFAAAALQGMLANGNSSGEPEDFALPAYKIADAMLVEREKEE